MLGEIGAGAFYGAIGGGLGALLGTLLALPFKNTRFSQMATLVLTVAGVVVGMNVAEPLLKPYIGQYLPSSSSESSLDAEIDKTFEELEQLPMNAAIFEKEPNFKRQLRRKLKQAAGDAASPISLRQSAFSIVFDETQKRTLYYLRRARNEDLVEHFTITLESLRYLSEHDPQFCFDSNYNPGALLGMDIPSLRAKYGEDVFNRLQQSGVQVIRNAYNDIPDYDAVQAQAMIDEAAVTLVQELGEGRLGLITGTQRPADVGEARLVCEATANLYETLLAKENGVDALRHLMVLT